MRTYELVYIVHPQVDQEELAGIVEEVNGLVESAGGVIQKSETWGLRRLAYPIQKIWEGQYVLLAFELEAQGVPEIERRLKLKEPVLRHLVVRLDED